MKLTLILTGEAERIFKEMVGRFQPADNIESEVVLDALANYDRMSRATLAGHAVGSYDVQCSEFESWSTKLLDTLKR